MITLILSGILGIGGHLLFKWRDAHTKGEKMRWKNHIVNGFVSVFVIAMLLFFRDEIKDVFPITKLTVFFAGYMSDSVWKNFTKFGSKKLGV